MVKMHDVPIYIVEIDHELRKMMSALHQMKGVARNFFYKTQSACSTKFDQK